MEDMRQSLLESGMDGFVTKPVSIPLLQSEIHRVTALATGGANA
jgi:CheY-like chemotaxis protein